MDQRAASGLQIAFLVLAVLLLAAPLDKYVFSDLQWVKQSGFPAGRTMIFIFAALVLCCIPSLRDRCNVLLAPALEKGRRAEVAVVVALNLVTAFAVMGLFALWWWSTGGEPALARRMGGHSTVGSEWTRAMSLNAIATFLLVGGLIAPIVEELIFRGLLYRAWERQWGWIRSAVATSLVFALAHPGGTGISQFLASLLFICLLRRTGSLRASIYAHALFNILLWYPLLGRHVFPGGRETGEISAWTFNLLCLAFIAVAIPVYMWMSRDEVAVAADAALGATAKP